MIERKRKTYSVIFWILLFIFVATFTVIGCCFLSNQDTADVSYEHEESASLSPELTDEKPEKIDLSGIVEDWVSSVGGEKSVLIYDLDRDEIAADYNIEKEYNTASLYKLFVAYEGYRRIENGEWQADEVAGYTGYTISECLDLSIRESHSPCAETIWAKIGHENLDEIINEDFKIYNSNISNLTSNAEDIAKMMKIFYEHPDIKDDELIAQIKDSFLNQPTTTYNWRQGLPSGFDLANVYNKVGWDYNQDGGYWEVYHDAAIVEFPEKNRHFIVVVMTNRIPFKQIRNLGELLEEAINKY